MSIRKGFQVDQRVGIAMDALSAGQQAALKPVLQSKEGMPQVLGTHEDS
jgi:hypothetical protein